LADIDTRGSTTWIVATLAYVASVVLIGCSDNAVTAPEPHGPPAPAPIQVLALATYDGSGQAVHPDAVQTPDGWGKGTPPLHLVVTPYPEGQASYENPSIYSGQSVTVWQVPQNVQNPIARPVTTGYLSDPDEVYNPSTKELWVYYRQVTTTNQILLLRSPDGIQWGTPVTIVTVPNHQAVSPTVVRKGADDWWLWTVNAGVNGCSSASTVVELRHSTDGIHWSDPQPVYLGGNDDFPWHVDVTWIPEYGEFWALYNAKTPGSCTTAVLRFATSQDGVHWTTAPTPLLTRGAIPEFADIVYRSSLTYDATSDLVTLWYSGARYEHTDYLWHVAVQQIPRTTLLANVMRTPSPSSSGAVTPAASLIPLTKPVAPLVPLTNATAP
jgi:hypothetical protein